MQNCVRLPLLALVAALSACGGGSDAGTVAPVTSGTPTPAPTPAPTPTPAPAALYQSPNTYSVGIKDGLTVTSAAERTLAIRVRYPASFRPAAGERLPVIVWSHGGELKDDGHLQNVEWGNTLATAGYVVVHIAHITQTIAQRDATYAQYGLTPTQGARCFDTALVLRPIDAAAVLAALVTIEARTPELPAPLDLARVAMAGHSFGAYTTRTMAGARVDLCPAAPSIAGFPVGWPHRDVSFRNAVPIAFMALSPQGPGRFGFFADSWSGLNRPDITMSGDGDDTQGEQPADRIVPYSLMPGGEKWLMYIASIGATHTTLNLNNNALQPEFTRWIASTGLAFMDTYLRNTPVARSWMTTNQVGAVSNGTARQQGR